MIKWRHRRQARYQKQTLSFVGATVGHPVRSLATDIKARFCNLPNACQRGFIGNAGLLRQYFPKEAGFNVIAGRSNGRYRKTLAYELFPIAKAKGRSWPI